MQNVLSDTHGTKRIVRKVESEYTIFRAKMRSWQNLVTSSYSIRTSPIYKQSSVCHADTIQLLHDIVAYMEQSAHQICSPISTHEAVSASD